MLLQIDSKYYPKTEKKDSLQKKSLQSPKNLSCYAPKNPPPSSSKKMGDKSLNPLV